MGIDTDLIVGDAAFGDFITANCCCMICSDLLQSPVTIKHGFSLKFRRAFNVTQFGRFFDQNCNFRPNF